jgi:hypothetical protein
MYEGTYIDGMAFGFGRFIWINKNVYTGMFENGLPYGNGTFVSQSDGKSYYGSWFKGILVSSNGTIEITIP